MIKPLSNTKGKSGGKIKKKSSVISPNYRLEYHRILLLSHNTEVRFASLLSSGFTTMAVINAPERKLAKHTSVQC